MEDEEFSDLWDKRHSLMYRVQLSVLYHQKRERFFELFDKVAKAIAVIGGSAALSKIGPDAIPYIAAVITVTSTLSLVFSFSDRARRHAELARNFKQIESDIVAKVERDFVEADIAAWDGKTRMLECSEPPALGALVVVCQNELAIQQGQKDSYVELPWYQRQLAHFIDFSPPRTAGS